MSCISQTNVAFFVIPCNIDGFVRTLKNRTSAPGRTDMVFLDNMFILTGE